MAIKVQVKKKPTIAALKLRVKALERRLEEQEREERKLVEIFREEFAAEGRDGDHDNLSPADTAIRTMRTLCSELAYMQRREAHFAQVLSVADGGQYQNDWDAAIERLVRERDRLLSRVNDSKGIFELNDAGA
jgi:hypothetical protein